MGEVIKNLRAANGSYTPVFMTIEEDPNIFIEMTGGAGMIFFQTVILSATVSALFFGVRSQILFGKHQGVKPTAAQLCLLFNNLGMVLLFVYFLDLYVSRPSFLHFFFLQPYKNKAWQ